MRSRLGITLPIAVAALTLFALPVAQGQDTPNQDVNQLSNKNAPAISTPAPAGAQSQAVAMVRARATLDGSLDAQHARPGDPVAATLIDNVRLRNGDQLAKGSTLMGTVVADNTQPGNTKLALRFTEAKTKSGESFPVAATIVAFYPPKPEHQSIAPPDPMDQPPNFWSANALQIDQVDALPGIDLHSQIAGNTSGVFVSDHKSDVKMQDGSQLALAIGPVSGQQYDTTGGY